MSRFGRIAVLLLVLLPLRAAEAQEEVAATARASVAVDTTSTRAGELRAMRLDKAQTLESYAPPGTIESLLARAEERMAAGGGAGGGFYGFSPVLGGLRQGAGLAAGLRFAPLGRGGRTLLYVEGAASLRKYWGIRGFAGYRWDSIVAAAYGQYRHMPQERFFGIGPGSLLANESTYRLNAVDAGALLGLHVSSVFGLGVQGGYVKASPGPGKDADVPTTQEAFDSLPALREETQHVSGGGWIRFDSRDRVGARPFYQELSPLEPGMVRMPTATRRGFFALAELTRYISRGGEAYGFDRLNLQSQQYIPFRRAHHVLAFRQFVALTRTDDSVVPFHMLPALGGAYTLRGYELFRFRDRHALLVNAEYRWNVWRMADMVLFVDAGDVFPTAGDVAVDGLKVSYGGGVRLRTSQTGLLRLEVGRSEEGTQIIMLLTSSF